MLFSFIKKCRGCNAIIHNNLWTLKMFPIPLVGKLYVNQEQALKQSALPLTWIRCDNCSLLQVLEDVEDTEIYDEYNYSSSSFTGLQTHFQAFASLIDKELSKNKRSRYLEIGCNDGILINRVQAASEKVGVDPSDIAHKACNGSYRLINEYFSGSMDTLLDEGSFDVITTSNSFAHFTDIRGAIKEIGRILKPSGCLFLEVHDGGLLLKEGQWDTIYHEHKVEWTEHSLAVCFSELGLKLVETTKLPMHGGTIRLKFIKAPIKKLNFSTEYLDQNLVRFKNIYDQRFENEVARELQELEAFCCYGASGRAVNWLYQMGLQGKVTCIYDDSHERKGKFIGNSGIEIREGHRVGEFDLPVVITAWNFSQIIREKHDGKNINWLQFYK